jgi:hypothetical protein
MRRQQFSPVRPAQSMESIVLSPADSVTPAIGREASAASISASPSGVFSDVPSVKTPPAMRSGGSSSFFFFFFFFWEWCKCHEFIDCRACNAFNYFIEND